MSNKEYSWNRNAPTNREAVIQFAGISIAAAVVPTICTTAVAVSLFMGGVLESWQALTVVPFVFMACFLLLFLTLVCVYNISNRGHERTARPPHPTDNTQKKSREIKGKLKSKGGKFVFDE